MTKKKLDRSLSTQVYQIDFEDGSSPLRVRPAYDSDEGYFSLEVRSTENDDEEIPLGRFLEPRGLDWPQIYNQDDLQQALETIFGESDDDLTERSLEIAEWNGATDITTLRPKAQRDAYIALSDVYQEIIEGTLHDNAVESGDDLFLRFGSILLRVTPRIILED